MYKKTDQLGEGKSVIDTKKNEIWQILIYPHLSYIAKKVSTSVISGK